MSQIISISEVLTELMIPSPTEFERGIVQEAIRKATGAVKRFLNYDPVQRERTEYYPLMDIQMQSRDFVWEATSTQAFQRRLAEAASVELQIKHIPIRSISSLRVDYDGRAGTKAGSFPVSSAWTEGTDFWRSIDGIDGSGNAFSLDGILRSEGSWPHQPGSVKIVYTAGYTEDEFRGEDTILDASPIWDVCLDETVRRIKKSASRFKKAASGLAPALLRFEQLGAYSYAIDTQASRLLVGGEFDLTPENREKLQDFCNLGSMLMM